MSYSIGRSQDLSKRLEELRPILAEKEASSGYLKFFDEFLGECELGLALHAVSDYLLEKGIPGPDDQTIDRIRVLHDALDISDDCVERLRAKIA